VHYSEEQKAHLKQQFVAKRRRQIILAIALVPIVVMWGLVRFWWGETPFLHLPVAGTTYFVIIAVMGGVIFSAANWRCPACGDYLGQRINQRKCLNCGIRFR
jgi:hypothetical protein